MTAASYLIAGSLVVVCGCVLYRVEVRPVLRRRAAMRAHRTAWGEDDFHAWAMELAETDGRHAS